jgi:nitrate reductase beta subunit
VGSTSILHPGGKNFEEHKMKIRAQISMVLNLDKCIGCHTCSVTCKNIWTNRKGVEYAWFNNVESKPGIGFPKNWEDQEKWNGGWVKKNGKLELKAGGRASKLLNIFANPDMPEIDDYYEPFDYDFTKLQNKPLSEAAPTARPLSQITGKRMEKIHWGPNWEDDLAGAFEDRSKDKNFDGMQKQMYRDFEKTFHMYLPRLCNHCLNPACVASCPSGAIYKREEDGGVLIDQDKCRSWRMCVSACPYKKIYYNWESGKSEKCILCYPRIESGMPTVCAESCVGRIRYMGVVLYDADKISDAAGVDNEKDLYQSQLDMFLDPNDPEVIAEALEQGISQQWLDAAKDSPVYKMAMDWKIAFPIHPEFRTLPMMWYVPPLSPVQSQIDQGNLPTSEDGVIPQAEALRFPVRYLANLLTAGDEAPILSALNRMLAMRSNQRTKAIENKPNSAALEAVGMTELQAEEMYQMLGIANYEDRFVIPTAHQEMSQEDPYAFQGQVGFSAGNISSQGRDSGQSFTLFPSPRKRTYTPQGIQPRKKG